MHWNQQQSIRLNIYFSLSESFCWSGSFSGILAQKFKVPDVVVFLLIGMGLGPEVREFSMSRPTPP